MLLLFSHTLSPIYYSFLTYYTTQKVSAFFCLLSLSLFLCFFVSVFFFSNSWCRFTQSFVYLSSMEVDWDLHAVVRGCCINSTTSSSSSSTVATTTTTTTAYEFDDHQSWFSSPLLFTSEQQQQQVSISNPFETRNAIEELHELYKPFFPKSPKSINNNIITTSTSITTTSSSSKQVLPPNQSHVISMTNSTPSNSHTTTTIPRSKRRKNQLKKVCQVPAEGLSSDVWAWRKYGQKPIKGSPYPRGYYRCSSSKGCLARKQVERNRSDPGMFIVTYTAEHNHPAPTHRNSLAGSTRQKPFTESKTQQQQQQPSSSSPATSEENIVPQSTNTESIELELLDTESKELDLLDDEEEEEEEGLSSSDMGVNDDFFVGLEERFSDKFPASFGLPWIANNAATTTTTAAGGI